MMIIYTEKEDECICNYWKISFLKRFLIRISEINFEGLRKAP